MIFSLFIFLYIKYLLSLLYIEYLLENDILTFYTGMREATRSRYGIILCHSTQQRKILRRLFRDNNGKVLARTEIWYIAEL